MEVGAKGAIGTSVLFPVEGVNMEEPDLVIVLHLNMVDQNALRMAWAVLNQKLAILIHAPVCPNLFVAALLYTYFVWFSLFLESHGYILTSKKAIKREKAVMR